MKSNGEDTPAAVEAALSASLASLAGWPNPNPNPNPDPDPDWSRRWQACRRCGKWAVANRHSICSKVCLRVRVRVRVRHSICSKVCGRENQDNTLTIRTLTLHVIEGVKRSVKDLAGAAEGAWGAACHLQCLYLDALLTVAPTQPKRHGPYPEPSPEPSPEQVTRMLQAERHGGQQLMLTEASAPAPRNLRWGWVGVRVHTWCEAGTESVSYSSTRSEVVSW